MLTIGKYRPIVMTVALFIVIDLAVLALDFKASNDANNYANTAQAFGELIQNSEKLKAQVNQLQLEVNAVGDVRTSLVDLQKTAAYLQSTLAAIRSGAPLPATGTQGSVTLPTFADEQAESIESAQKLWAPVHDNITYLASIQSIEGLNRNLPETQTRVSQSFGKLMDELQGLQRQALYDAVSAASFTRNLQIISLFASVALFVLIVLIFIQKMVLKDKNHEIALKETEEILNNVDEGLFLLNQELKIQSQRSAAMGPMFGNRDLDDLPFRQLLQNLVPDKTIDLTEDYVVLLLKNRVNENLVDSLNPLDELELNIDKGNGIFENKYFSFKFHRSYRDNKVNHLLVTVVDITELVKLRKELDALKEDTDMQVDMIQKIIHVDPSQINNFIQETRSALNSINEILKERSMNVIDFKEKLISIKQLAHKIKGDASALELENFARLAHELEDLIEPLTNKSQLTGTDFLPLTLKLNRFMDYLDLIDKLVAATPKNTTSRVSKRPKWDRLGALAKEVARTEDKKVSVNLQDFNFDQIPDEYGETIKDVLIQMIRNAIVHGIESEIDRKKQGKPTTGTIKISFEKDGNEYSLKIYDDGVGIDLDRIRDIAIRKNRLTKEQVDALVPAQVMSLIFEPGFTTQSKVTQNAGRGIGMDFVKTKIKSQGGKIKVASSNGKYCQFDIRLPVSKASSVEHSALRA